MPEDPVSEYLRLEPGTPAHGAAVAAIEAAITDYHRLRVLVDGYESVQKKQLLGVLDALQALEDAESRVDDGARLAAGLETDESAIPQFIYSKRAVPEFAAKLRGWINSALYDLSTALAGTSGRRRPTTRARDNLVMVLAYIFDKHRSPSVHPSTVTDFQERVLVEHGILRALPDGNPRDRIGR